MPSCLSPSSHRGFQRAPHLRKLSSGSSNSGSQNYPGTATSNTGTVQYDHLLSPSRLAMERKSVVWVHDESFSKEDVVLNLDLFPGVQPGELMAIMPLNSDSILRDFQFIGQGMKRDLDSLENIKQRQQTYSEPKSPHGIDQAGLMHDVEFENRYLFIPGDMTKEMKLKQTGLEISVAKHIADTFGLKHRSNVLVATTDTAVSSASHVELSFKDEYLARSDMWRLAVGELSNKTVYRGQKILFIGSIKVQVTRVYLNGRKVRSAFFSTATKPIFRSESARYFLFIQMSREMWDFDSEGSGEIMFNKAVNGFLPTLFKKWVALKVKHLVSVVLFTRVEYDTGITSDLAADAHDSAYYTGIQPGGNRRPYKDFYRVVVSEMASGSWTTILYQLKREFKFFRRDISIHRINIIASGNIVPPERQVNGVLGTRLEAEPSLALHGNVLEAINLAVSDFAHDYIDRDLMRTGISIVIITPCAGLFEVDYDTLRMTTETLIGNGIGIDLVCLPKMPLHCAPLFRYRNPQYATFLEALHIKTLRSEESTPRQQGTYTSNYSSLIQSLSPVKISLQENESCVESLPANIPPDEWLYAMPHWLDISFWTGASNDVNPSRLVPQVFAKNLGGLRQHRVTDFAVRCKMYELEMASIMESILTEISVTPLQYDAHLSRMTMSTGVSYSDQNPKGSSSTIGAAKPYTGLSEFINGPSKNLLGLNSSLDERRLHQALDDFDVKSQLSQKQRSPRQKDPTRRNHHIDSEESFRRPPVGETETFNTFFNETLGVRSSSFSSRSASRRGRPRDNTSLEVPESRRARKDLLTKKVSVETRYSPVKNPKVGRHISFGKHGFGISAPKVAAAEIFAEHASATTSASSISKFAEHKPISGSITSHFLPIDRTHALERPSSSQSEKLEAVPSTPGMDSKTFTDAWNIGKAPVTKPMTIRSALESLDSTNQFVSRSVLGSLHVGSEGRSEEHIRPAPSTRTDDSQRLYNSKLLAGSVPELPATLSPTTALSPWLSVLNPSNPSFENITGPGRNRRWQQVVPKSVVTNIMKWKSLCAPASVPLTTEFFPTKHQLDTEYQQKPYKISQNMDEDLNDTPRSRQEFLRELVGLRLSHGFQIVVGPAVAEAFGQKSLKLANVFNEGGIAEDGSSIFMSMGNIIHQLSCVNDEEVEINILVRKPTISSTANQGSIYNPAIRTALGQNYDCRSIVLGRLKDEYNWNYVDAFLAGFDEEMSDSLRFWRARFVLIPVDRPTQGQRRLGEDNEEEIRLEGIKKLTQMWQRHRLLTASERRSQSVASRKTKDPNPLDIVYKTEDPSIVVTAELETLPLVETGEYGTRKSQLLETERFQKSKLDIAALAEAIQAPIERGGVRMQNRRWHLRLHYNCFIGSDMTTWLIENFEDVETREDAVELGNKLMARDEPAKSKEKDICKEKERDWGIFVHVEKRHPFRDGQYFYQVTGEFAKQAPENRSGWFASKRRDASVPSTPLTEQMNRDSPRMERSRSGSNYDEKSSDSGTATPTTTTGAKRPRVALSKVMKYDVDHRKRSYRTERINLHYDRLHNPDNCYHIRIDWIGVTAKLIEDAIESWATTAERYGLKLVEAPIGEACNIASVSPFRGPYCIELAVPPPDRQPRTYLDINSFLPQAESSLANRQFYQKAIMKKYNFVLDVEAARNFPSNVDVYYSWGRPDFKYSQYIHRSGVLLAQITDNGGFLLVANRLYNNRAMAARDLDRYVKFHSLDHSNRVSSMQSQGEVPERPSPVNPSMPEVTSMDSPLLPANSDALSASTSLGLKPAHTTTTPESIIGELEAFCHNAELLQAFYQEVFDPAAATNATPPSYRSPQYGPVLEPNIPTLGLPPSVLARDSSPTPLRLGCVMGANLQVSRRPSMHVNVTGNSESAK